MSESFEEQDEWLDKALLALDSRYAELERRLNDKAAYIDKRIESSMARADQLIAEAEKVAAQTTIVAVEVMEEMQITRTLWLNIREEQGSGA